MVNIMFTYGWVMEKVKQFLATENITHQQYNILRILKGIHPEPLSTLQIRERMLDKMSDTSRIVDRLIVKGLAKKNICKADKRLVDVSITKSGSKLLEKLEHVSKEIDAIFSNLSDKEAETLSKLSRLRRDQIRNVQ